MRAGRTYVGHLAGFSLVLSMGLAACASHTGGAGAFQSFLKRQGVAESTTQRVAYCAGGGCRLRQSYALSPSAWQAIQDLWQAVHSPVTERAAIAKAVALYEQALGPLAGTTHDGPGTFNFGHGTQLDCIDEASNTAVLLQLLATHKLLRFHQPTGPLVRGHFLTSWPHTAISLTATVTDEVWVVDSWAQAPGTPAWVQLEADWRAGETLP